ncbi:MAG: hypothetical protein Q9227_006673 [Pyrenula ochraceoflavens]
MTSALRTREQFFPGFPPKSRILTYPLHSFTSYFFFLGQTLPTIRKEHSPPGSGGPFQPTMTEAIRLLSRIPGPAIPSSTADHDHDGTHLPQTHPHFPHDIIDPFSSLPNFPSPSYHPGPPSSRSFLSPSSYPNNSYSWIHIFPEGRIHQSTPYTLRYFKWGLSRLILEPPHCPEIIPIFIQGTDSIMHESRLPPRWLPRPGNHVCITFGEPVDTDAVFGDLRRRWAEIKSDEDREILAAEQGDGEGGVERRLGILGEKMKYGKEAVELRVECARRMREEVLKVRRGRGLPEEDPKFGLAETWQGVGKREGRLEDGSWEKDT